VQRSALPAAPARCARGALLRPAAGSCSCTPQHQILRAARAHWAASPALREDYKQHRPNVERAIAQIATSRGGRIKLRYRGTIKNNAWLRRRAAAVNLRNLIGRGLTRQAGGAWVLAAT
jgi:hypothetical protein